MAEVDQINQQTAQPETVCIAAQNDAFRRMESEGGSGQWVHTTAVDDAGPEFRMACVAAISVYDNFDGDNDPYGTREMGLMEVHGKKVWWKIDRVDAPSHNGIAMCQTGFVGSQ